MMDLRLLLVLANSSAGLTQFEAEDLLYERLVVEEINPEFELFISILIVKKFITNQEI